MAAVLVRATVTAVPGVIVAVGSLLVNVGTAFPEASTCAAGLTGGATLCGAAACGGTP
ncbi:MAG: hypothetical protein ABR615_10190 [Pseudonocardiaceae bacterium]